MSDARILPCPFCGGEANSTNLIHEDSYGYRLWNVYCTGCSISTQPYWDKEIAIKDWNTRKPVERILEKLEKELELSEAEMETCVFKALPYYDRTLGYSTAIYNAIQIIKEEVQHD